MRVDLQAAYLLHHRPYRNTSLLLDVFTPEFGRVSLIAKGVRSRKAPKRALLQPFNRLLISWVGKTDLCTMTDVEVASLPHRYDGKALYSGFYLNELLVRLLHKYDPHQSIFVRYEDTLKSLQNVSALEPVLRAFEYYLLKDLGYELQLTAEAHTGELILKDAQYVYNVELGPVLSKVNQGQHSTNVFSGKALLAIANEEFDLLECRKEIKALMRLVLTHYLGGKPLKSRELFYSH